MYEYIKGHIIESSPAHCVVENNGLGYFINISVNTYTKLQNQKEIQLYLYEQIREDVHNLYGFYDTSERSIFIHLISVSGIGANTARMMLSSSTPAEIQEAILTGNVNLLKGIKGIGAKTAQRIIVDLTDKLGKDPVDQKIFADVNNTIKEEALSALVMLGFMKGGAQKVIDKILAAEPDSKVEDVIKKSLKML
ncbi:Holliday junction branch migration protein RuvA [Saccharicrinis fermentans]|uniref:Holliday junction branch migration complex subunit RuvA n=1 Tax=Saccharicrinis fermentans DSM 9555 = JCM 21142 TaxID=869213 RepID=W7YKE6_9BACT|nr:Holliday junction branch migration protein RuvA [Saccharicrinis fermentans]GAF04996.1 Holliday junction ATP-dependent DNA helicase RuvA [Saccharicrinis fermentans DSM 9555 = JCM 21142]